MMERRGVTLTEILMAMGILAVAILGLIAAFIAGTHLVANSQEVATATQLTRSELERIRDLGYNLIPDADVTFDGRNPDPALSGFPPLPYPGPPNSDYRMVVKVEQRGYYLKSVAVETHWGLGHKVVLQAYIHP